MVSMEFGSDCPAPEIDRARRFEAAPPRAAAPQATRPRIRRRVLVLLSALLLAAGYAIARRSTAKLSAPTYRR